MNCVGQIFLIGGYILCVYLYIFCVIINCFGILSSYKWCRCGCRNPAPAQEGEEGKDQKKKGFVRNMILTDLKLLIQREVAEILHLRLTLNTVSESSLPSSSSWILQEITISNNQSDNESGKEPTQYTCEDSCVFRRNRPVRGVRQGLPYVLWSLRDLFV